MTLDQRHRLSIAAIYESDFVSHLSSGFLRNALSHWAIGTTMQFASGRPYAPLLGVSALSNSVNNTLSAPEHAELRPRHQCPQLQPVCRIGFFLRTVDTIDRPRSDPPLQSR